MEWLKDLIRLFYPDTEEEEKGEIERDWTESYIAFSLLMFIFLVYAFLSN